MGGSDRRGPVTPGVLACGLLLAAVLGGPSGCKRADSAVRILEHRQQFTVEVKSWVPRDGGVLAEFQIVALFRPEIDTLTVRVVGFDESGSEVGSTRVSLPVKGMQVGVLSVVRQEIALTAPRGALGVEIESAPPPSAWGKFEELAGLSPPAGPAGR